MNARSTLLRHADVARFLLKYRNCGVFKPSPLEPKYSSFLIFDGISVEEAG